MILLGFCWSKHQLFTHSTRKEFFRPLWLTKLPSVKPCFRAISWSRRLEFYLCPLNCIIKYKSVNKNGFLRTHLPPKIAKLLKLGSKWKWLCLAKSYAAFLQHISRARSVEVLSLTVPLARLKNKLRFIEDLVKSRSYLLTKNCYHERRFRTNVALVSF